MKDRRHRSHKQQRPAVFRKAGRSNYKGKRLLKIRSDLSPINVVKHLRKAYRERSQAVSLLGVSGVGKSAATRRMLSLYGQITSQDTGQDQPAAKSPIPWLKLDCPTDSTPRSLSLTFFATLGKLLGNT